MSDVTYLAHYGRSKTDGAKRGSGRYPLGSGERPYQDYPSERRKAGLSDKTKRRLKTAGKVALGLAAAGAVGYGAYKVGATRKDLLRKKTTFNDAKDYFESVARIHDNNVVRLRSASSRPTESMVRAADICDELSDIYYDSIRKTSPAMKQAIRFVDMFSKAKAL